MSGPEYEVTERRPLATRELRASKVIADWLAARGASPNGISLAGLVSGVLAGLALAATARYPDSARLLWLAGAVFIQIRLGANMFDGMVAVRRGKASPVGELYNEIPDRISDAATLIGLGCAAGSHPVAGYVAACMALFVAYVRAMGKAAGAHQEFCGPMAKPQRMFLATVAALACAIVPAAAADWRVPAWTLAFIIAGGAVTACRRIVRIAAALRRKE